MTDKPGFDAGAHIDHMAEVLALEIRPEWRDGVALHMTNTAKAARLVLDFPLGDDVEAAPVFRP